MPAVQCATPEELEAETIPAKAITMCREAYLEPAILAFPGSKIVAIGKTAAHSIHRKARAIRELIGHPTPVAATVTTAVAVGLGASTAAGLIPEAVSAGPITKHALCVWNPVDFQKYGRKQTLLDIRRALFWALRDASEKPL